MNTKHCLVNGHNIVYVEENPTGNKTILFIHGNSLSKEIFSKQLTNNKFKDFRLLALDLPGHGESQWLEAYSVNQIVEDITSFCEEVILNSFIIVGHSLGGHMAIQALPKLKKCSGIFLIGTPPLQLPLNIEEAFMPHPAIPLLFKKELNKAELNIFSEALTLPEHQMFVKDQLNNTDLNFREQLLNSIQEGQMQDEVKILNKSNLPVAMIFGEEDKLVNFDYLKNIKLSQLDEKTPMYIKGGSHLPTLERDSVLDKLILDFSDRI
ncbi:MAG: hypothetical protein CMC13_16145 [Flavobacteriaceae bacterium]|nr:hypothetical protein [Flavobacteriaceae bacterium]|tara:strand:- start:2196 stop:2993 length:798 start_codon:yes stop_codon:yes gene_type:complete